MEEVQHERLTGLPRLRTSPPEEVPPSRTSYWSPLVTTRSPLSFVRTSSATTTRFASWRSAGAAQSAQQPHQLKALYEYMST